MMQHSLNRLQTTYSCTPGNSSNKCEVHVLTVYEVVNRRPPSASDATVNIALISIADVLIVDFLMSLADAHGCRIQLNTDTALAKPLYNNQKPTSIYSCAPGNSSPRYEVHVLAMYEGNRHTRPPTAGDTTVNIVNRSDRPIILVLGSYEPVNWILSLPADIVISKVILVSTPQELKSAKLFS